MRKRSCLNTDFWKESVSQYLLNFHYIVLFSIFQIFFSLLILPAGPAWIAMCRCLRNAAEGKKVSVLEYFSVLWQFRIRGLLYSVIIVCTLTGMIFGSVLGQIESGGALAISSQICAGLMLALSIYVPFTLRPERKVLSAIYDSCMYFFGHFVSSVMLMSVIVIVFLVSWWLTPALTFLILPGTAGFFLSRTIVGINEDMEQDP